MGLASLTVEPGAPLVVLGGTEPPRVLVALVATLPLFLLIVRSGAYSGTLGSGIEEFRAIVRGGVQFVALFAVAELLLEAQLSRRLVVLGVVAAVVLVGVARYLTRKGLHRRRSQGLDCHQVLVLGAPASVAELTRHLEASRYVGFRVVGVRTDTAAPTGRLAPALPEGVAVRPSSEPVLDAVAAVGADVVAVAGGPAAHEGSGVRALAWELEGTGIGLMVAPDVVDVAGPRLRVHPVAGLPLLELSEPQVAGTRRSWRAIYDRVGAVLLGLATIPVWVPAALAVAVSSKGPVLYRQTRVGLGGKEFTLYKLRSMVDGADQQLDAVADGNISDGPLFKLPEDPRVTRVGRVLRRWSIDELPQLVNVLRGDMALVGPRPPLPSEVAQYDEPTHRRLLVKPGITGLWQVSGRADLSWDEAVRLDLHYVDNWSPALDVLILWKTLGAVLHRRGAY